jgi:hypothetical protein
VPFFLQRLNSGQDPAPSCSPDHVAIAEKTIGSLGSSQARSLAALINQQLGGAEDVGVACYAGDSRSIFNNSAPRPCNSAKFGQSFGIADVFTALEAEPYFMRILTLSAIILMGAGFVSVLTAFSEPALAQSGFGHSSWSSPSDIGCGIYLNFSPDGTATVSEASPTGSGLSHGDTAHWTLEGSVLDLKFDTWYGGIDGVIFNGNQIKANETYQDKETQDVRHRSCLFSKDK